MAMPANLTPQYLEAERRFRAAATPQEKLEALKEMLAEIPKHKGTEKLQAEIKRKIAKVKNEIQRAGKHGPKTHSYHVRKEGAGQIAVVGPPNVGKSSLVAKLTHARPDIADYPFSTRTPCPGMMDFENIQIQLLDLPPVSAEYMEYWVPNLIRNADACAVLVDLSAPDPAEQFKRTRDCLYEKKIRLVKEPPEEPEDIRYAYKRTVVFANKADLDPTGELLELVREMLEIPLELHPLSIFEDRLLEDFRRTAFRMLHIVRVYSKPPGKPVDYSRPFVLPEGSTLYDLAEEIHREFAENLRFARVWGEGKFDGQRVNRDYVLMDGDIVELHI